MALSPVILRYKTRDLKLNVVLEDYKRAMNYIIDVVNALDVTSGASDALTKNNINSAYLAMAQDKLYIPHYYSTSAPLYGGGNLSTVRTLSLLRDATDFALDVSDQLYILDSGIDHDATTNYVEAEHLSLPNTIANVLSDHDKSAHDALNIDADTLDGIDSTGFSVSGHTHSGVYEPVLGNPSNDGYVLSSTALGVRSWIEMSGGGEDHDLLSETHLDTVAASPVEGDILYANATPAWTKLAKGTTAQYLKGGDAPSWAALNQAAVAGLTTTDGPTFDHVHFGGSTLIRISNNINIGDGFPNITTGNQNCSIGVYAQTGITSGSNNIACGYGCQYTLQSGVSNIGVGTSAQYSITTGAHNIGVGYQAQLFLTEGGYNIGLGYQAQYSGTTASHNIGIGYAVQRNITTGLYNIGIGYRAQYGITTGSSNMAIGYNAQYSLTTGSGNLSIGDGTLYSISSGACNTVIGLESGGFITTGSYNTVLGYRSGYNMATGNSCVFLGYQAGYYETASNKLMIDNTQRANEADARAKALVYGIFNSTTANQYVTVNGHLGALEDISVAGTKVVGVRVIDARLSNVPNSGDATTDDLIDALRDLVIAHGLGASA